MPADVDLRARVRHRQVALGEGADLDLHRVRRRGDVRRRARPGPAGCRRSGPGWAAPTPVARLPGRAVEPVVGDQPQRGRAGLGRRVGQHGRRAARREVLPQRQDRVDRRGARGRPVPLPLPRRSRSGRSVRWPGWAAAAGTAMAAATARTPSRRALAPITSRSSSPNRRRPFSPPLRSTRPQPLTRSRPSWPSSSEPAAGHHGEGQRAGAVRAGRRPARSRAPAAGARPRPRCPRSRPARRRRWPTAETPQVSRKVMPGTAGAGVANCRVASRPVQASWPRCAGRPGRAGSRARLVTGEEHRDREDRPTTTWPTTTETGDRVAARRPDASCR